MAKGQNQRRSPRRVERTSLRTMLSPVGGTDLVSADERAGASVGFGRTVSLWRTLSLGSAMDMVLNFPLRGRSPVSAGTLHKAFLAKDKYRVLVNPDILRGAVLSQHIHHLR